MQATIKYPEIEAAMVGKNNNPSRCIGLVGKALHENGVEQQRLERTAGYMARCGAGAAHLAIGDRGARRWAAKVFRQQEAVGRVIVEIWGIQAV